jgi:hypothetical protein
MGPVVMSIMGGVSNCAVCRQKPSRWRRAFSLRPGCSGSARTRGVVKLGTVAKDNGDVGLATQRVNQTHVVRRREGATRWSSRHGLITETKAGGVGGR